MRLHKSDHLEFVGNKWIFNQILGELDILRWIQDERSYNQIVVNFCVKLLI